MVHGAGGRAWLDGDVLLNIEPQTPEVCGPRASAAKAFSVCLVTAGRILL